MLCQSNHKIDNLGLVSRCFFDTMDCGSKTINFYFYGENGEEIPPINWGYVASFKEMKCIDQRDRMIAVICVFKSKESLVWI